MKQHCIDLKLCIYLYGESYLSGLWTTANFEYYSCLAIDASTVTTLAYFKICNFWCIDRCICYPVLVCFVLIKLVC
jgi:hypothetical protein